ncbi:MetA-pathway of phenol degradation, putative [Methylophilaceae bacterium]
MNSERYIFCMIIGLLLVTGQAYAIDLNPGDLRPLKPGVNLIMLSYQQSNRSDRYSQGDKQAGNPEIQAAQTQIRLAHAFDIAEHPAIFFAQTAIGYTHPEADLSAAKGDSGMADTTFLLAMWPYANHESKSYFAVGAYLTLPTGSYAAERSFNMGQNRYNAALQVGYQAPLLKDLNGVAAFDAVWFADNDAYGVTHKNLEQKLLYTSQLGLQYMLTPSYSVSATYFYTVGGETSLDGVSRDDITRLQRYQLTGQANFSFGRISLQYGGDLKTENGYIEDSRWLLRYTKLF